VCALATLCLVAFAQAGQVSQSEPYRIQEEDVVRMQVWDETQLSAEMLVGPDGYVNAPFLGRIRAAGKTTSELEAEFKDLYIKTLRLIDPKVSVSVSFVRRIKANITGEVGRANTYEMRPTDTVRTLLTLGGGTTATADLSRAVLYRKNSREGIPIDLKAMIERGDLSQDYRVEDGDTLVIPARKNYYVRVVGKIRRPGVVPYQDQMTLMDALTFAEWEIPLETKFSEVLVIRPNKGQPGKYTRIQCDIVKYIRKGDENQNIVLYPGDQVYVPGTGRPNLDLISSVANFVFILERFGIPLFRP
jgi:protein involved in polysaccharide export with SLBB domain